MDEDLGKMKPFDENGECYDETAMRCTIVGIDVPMPTTSDTVRIGSGERYLEILPDGTARIVGATGDEATQAIIAGIKTAMEHAYGAWMECYAEARKNGWPVAKL